MEIKIIRCDQGRVWLKITCGGVKTKDMMALFKDIKIKMVINKEDEERSTKNLSFENGEKLAMGIKSRGDIKMEDT